MGHISNSYLDLHKRLEKMPQHAPASEALFQILEMLFTEKEATLVSKLPIKPFDIPIAAKLWKQSAEESEIILNELADKGLLIDVMENSIQWLGSLNFH
ncbi:MAG: hypothetical protein ACTSPA_05565 [Promethearchaeota archaeon]